MEPGPNRFHQALWPRGQPVVGMIHLLPLPGSPRWGGSMSEVEKRALREADLLQAGGLTGLLVENYGDVPFFPGPTPSETVAAMAVVVGRVVRASDIPVGVNLLRNDALGALAVAQASGARFIRVNVHTGCMFTDQGILQGTAHETLRRRASLGASIAILADVFVKHATPPAGATLEGAARDTWHRGMADGLILTGTETGEPPTGRDIDRVRAALPREAPVWIGSGATPETALALLEAADGIIVGSALQEEGRAGGGVASSRVTAFMEAVKR